VDLLAVVEREAAGLRAAAARDLRARVPSCPDWDVADLLRHVSEVYEHKATCVELGGPKPDPWPPQWPDRDPLAWFDDALARLLRVLRGAAPTAPSWTWFPDDQTAGFWHRRMAHETAVHRVDAELATGTATPVDEALAVDGVDELLAVVVDDDWVGYEEPDLCGEVVVRTGGRAWTAVMVPDRFEVTAEARPTATATVSGEPSDVLLWLYGRGPLDPLRVEGEADAVRRLRARVAKAT
jgi:uncharacterized protein (TIGR03083 family)